MLDPISLLAAGLIATTCIAALAFRKCPANTALIVYEGEKPTAQSIIRVARASTFINVLKSNKQKVQILELSTLVFPASFKFGDLYLHCQLEAAPDDSEAGLKRAALAGSSKQEREKTLTRALEKITVTHEMLPDSFESFCLIEREREKCPLAECISDTLAESGHRLISWTPFEVSIERESILPGQEESSLSSLLRTVNFKTLELEVISHSNHLSKNWGTLNFKWALRLRPPSGLEQYGFACQNFLGTTADAADRLITETVCQSLDEAARRSGAEKWFSKIESILDSPVNQFESDTQAAIALLNLLADTVSNWRGKLKLTRLALEGFLALKKFDRDIDLLVAEKLASYGLVFEKVGLLSVALDEHTARMIEPQKGELTVNLNFPQLLEYEGAKEEIIVICQVHLQSDGSSKSAPAELEKLFQSNLKEALQSAKIPQLVALLKGMSAKIKPEEMNFETADWERKIKEHLIQIGPTQLVISLVRILFAALDAYQDVRKCFVHGVEKELLNYNLTLKYFSIVDIQPAKSDS